MMITIWISFSTGQGSHGEWTDKTVGTWGNSIGVQICDAEIMVMNKIY